MLLVAAVGSIEADVPLSPLVRGAAGVEGLRRLWNGELDFNSVVATLVGREDDADKESKDEGMRLIRVQLLLLG